MLEKVMQKTWKMTPTWRQNGGRNPSKNMKKQYKKTSRKMMQKLSAKKLWARRGDGPGKRALGPGVPEEVRSSSGDSRSRFPLASNILQKTNTRQTTKKQPRNTNPTRTHLACRQARCGSIIMFRAPGSMGISGSCGVPATLLQRYVSCRKTYVFRMQETSPRNVPVT